MDETRWPELTGGYRMPYGSRPAIGGLTAGQGWAELWENLYHQGDVGTASYVAAPLIADLGRAGPVADWNAYALVATIEEARRDTRNPPLPSWLVDDYGRAWGAMFDAGIAELRRAADETLINSIMAVLAAHKGQPALSRLAMWSEAERQQMLDEIGWA